MSAPSAAKKASESQVEMVQLVHPGDANALNTAFGGWVMSHIDIAAAIAAQRHARQQVVTASMDDLHFHASVKIGWQVILRARVIAAFGSSMEIGVTVHSEDPLTGERRLTTTALLTFVALDKSGAKLPVPPLLFETDEEKRAAEEAQARRAERLSRKNVGKSWLGLLGHQP